MTIHTSLSLRNRRAKADWLRRQADAHECIVFADPRDSEQRVSGIRLRRRQRHAKLKIRLDAVYASAGAVIERFVGRLKTRASRD